MGLGRNVSRQSLFAMGCLLGLLVGCTQNPTPPPVRGGEPNPIQDPDAGTPILVDGGVKQPPSGPGDVGTPSEPHDAQRIRKENARPGTSAGASPRAPTRTRSRATRSSPRCRRDSGCPSRCR
ncbi:hypothetical protein ACN28S_35375 [Cystobacter fuscus]